MLTTDKCLKNRVETLISIDVYRYIDYARSYEIMKVRAWFDLSVSNFLPFISLSFSKARRKPTFQNYRNRIRGESQIILRLVQSLSRTKAVKNAFLTVFFCKNVSE